MEKFVRFMTIGVRPKRYQAWLRKNPRHYFVMLAVAYATNVGLLVWFRHEEEKQRVKNALGYR